MNILINTSNLRVGGGVQVAESICRMIPKYKNHIFYVVLSDTLLKIKNEIIVHKNVHVINYSQPLSIFSIITGRDKVLDRLVDKYRIDCVLTVFGPSRWHPRCFHLCGFAMPHIVLNDSPYWKRLSAFSLLKSKLRNYMMVRDFKSNNDVLWCENNYITQKLQKIFKDKPIATITNNFNQIFDNPKKWDNSILLKPFSGITLLTISANYPHKNFSIALPVLEEIERHSPDLKLRFVFTITQDQFPFIPEEYRDNFIFLGPVSINQCPPLYEQADIMFQPSLLECFSATYAEAMKMNVPILTTDLGFAHSLCGDAAIYYEATNPKSLAQAIIQLANNRLLRNNLVIEGKKQLSKYDTFEERADKLIKILETNK